MNRVVPIPDAKLAGMARAHAVATVVIEATTRHHRAGVRVASRPSNIRAETRATLVASIARGRHWLDEIVAGTVTSVEQIAARNKCSIRQVNM